MIILNLVLFWVSLVIFISAVALTIFLIVKKREQKALIYTAILMIFSVITTVMQQLGIVFGTRAGITTFWEIYAFSLLGIIFFVALLGYITWLFIKIVKYLELKIEQKPKIVDEPPLKDEKLED